MKVKLVSKEVIVNANPVMDAEKTIYKKLTSQPGYLYVWQININTIISMEAPMLDEDTRIKIVTKILKLFKR